MLRTSAKLGSWPYRTGARPPGEHSNQPFVARLWKPLQGTGEEDEEGNPVLPVIDDRGLTEGQRLKHLRDERDLIAREKQRAYTEHRWAERTGGTDRQAAPHIVS